MTRLNALVLVIAVAATGCYVKSKGDVTVRDHRADGDAPADQSPPDRAQPHGEVRDHREGGETAPPTTPPDRAQPNDKLGGAGGGAKTPPDRAQPNDKLGGAGGGAKTPPHTPPGRAQPNDKLGGAGGGAKTPPGRAQPNDKLGGAGGGAKTPPGRVSIPDYPVKPTWKFSIQPTTGTVGTGVEIFGDFRRTKNPREVSVIFPGAKPVPPSRLSERSISVTVPAGAKSGKVRVTIGGKDVWSGAFTVVAPSDGIVVVTPTDTGLLGAVYKLTARTKRLPNFARLGDPFTTILVANLAIAPRRFTAGFPGLDGKTQLLEWFGIRFVGKIHTDTDEQVFFQLNSDDGARLIIDGKRVIDNDGVHPAKKKTGAIKLKKGSHDIVVEYFQGPRFEIALELSWRFDDGEQFTIVPASAFTRY